MLTLIASIALYAVRKTVLPGENAGALMQTLLHQIPAFFTYYNVMLLLWGIGSTVLLTAAGCGAGFLFRAAVIVLVRVTKTVWMLPLKILLITYVEFFRRIPFHRLVILSYFVLFAAQAIDPTLSLLLASRSSACACWPPPICRRSSGPASESVQRPQIEAADAMNFGFWRTMFPKWWLPQAWKVLFAPPLATAFVIFMFIKDVYFALASQVQVLIRR